MSVKLIPLVAHLTTSHGSNDPRCGQAAPERTVEHRLFVYNWALFVNQALPAYVAKDDEELKYCQACAALLTPLELLTHMEL